MSSHGNCRKEQLGVDQQTARSQRMSHYHIILFSNMVIILFSYLTSFPPGALIVHWLYHHPHAWTSTTRASPSPFPCGEILLRCLTCFNSAFCAALRDPLRRAPRGMSWPLLERMASRFWLQRNDTPYWLTGSSWARVRLTTAQGVVPVREVSEAMPPEVVMLLVKVRLRIRGIGRAAVPARD